MAAVSAQCGDIPHLDAGHAPYPLANTVERTAKAVPVHEGSKRGHGANDDGTSGITRCTSELVDRHQIDEYFGSPLAVLEQRDQVRPAAEQGDVGGVADAFIDALVDAPRLAVDLKPHRRILQRVAEIVRSQPECNGRAASEGVGGALADRRTDEAWGIFGAVRLR